MNSISHFLGSGAIGFIFKDVLDYFIKSVQTKSPMKAPSNKAAFSNIATWISTISYAIFAIVFLVLGISNIFEKNRMANIFLILS